MISAILLAAGQSKRMINENKLVKKYKNIPLIKYAVDNVLKYIKGTEIIKNIYLKDLWPSSKEIDEILQKSLSSDMFVKRYKEIYEGDDNWKSIISIKRHYL